jgi:hypothetical protein
VLPAEQPDSSLDNRASPTERPLLSAVPPSEEDQHGLPFEDGLLRSAVVGGVIGFTVVFVMVCAGLLLADLDLAYVLPSAVFVAAFGGVGFGGMQAAALHKPRES